MGAQPDPESAPDLGVAWSGGASLAFHITAGNYDPDTLIKVLDEPTPVEELCANLKAVVGFLHLFEL